MALLGGSLAAGGGWHLRQLGGELNPAPRQFVGFGEPVHEPEDLEIPSAIALHGLVILELEKTDVPVVVLDGLLLETPALLGPECELGILAVDPHRRLFGALPVEMKPGLVPHGFLAVGPTFHVHLEDSEIDAQLDLLAILALKTARHHLTGFVIPVLQHLGEVERHRPANMETSSGSVNAQGRRVITNPGVTALGQNAADHLAVDIGETEITALEAVGQLEVIDPEEVQERGVEIVHVDLYLDGVDS